MLMLMLMLMLMVEMVTLQPLYYYKVEKNEIKQQPSINPLKQELILGRLEGKMDRLFHFYDIETALLMLTKVVLQ